MKQLTNQQIQKLRDLGQRSADDYKEAIIKKSVEKGYNESQVRAAVYYSPKNPRLEKAEKKTRSFAEGMTRARQFAEDVVVPVARPAREITSQMGKDLRSMSQMIRTGNYNPSGLTREQENQMIASDRQKLAKIGTRGVVGSALTAANVVTAGGTSLLAAGAKMAMSSPRIASMVQKSAPFAQRIGNLVPKPIRGFMGRDITKSTASGVAEGVTEAAAGQYTQEGEVDRSTLMLGGTLGGGLRGGVSAFQQIKPKVDERTIGRLIQQTPEGAVVRAGAEIKGVNPSVIKDRIDRIADDLSEISGITTSGSGSKRLAAAIDADIVKKGNTYKFLKENQEDVLSAIEKSENTSSQWQDIYTNVKKKVSELQSAHDSLTDVVIGRDLDPNKFYEKAKSLSDIGNFADGAPISPEDQRIIAKVYNNYGYDQVLRLFPEDDTLTQFRLRKASAAMSEKMKKLAGGKVSDSVSNELQDEIAAVITRNLFEKGDDGLIQAKKVTPALINKLEKDIASSAKSVFNKTELEGVGATKLRSVYKEFLDDFNAPFNKKEVDYKFLVSQYKQINKKISEVDDIFKSGNATDSDYIRLQALNKMKAMYKGIIDEELANEVVTVSGKQKTYKDLGNELNGGIYMREYLDSRIKGAGAIPFENIVNTSQKFSNPAKAGAMGAGLGVESATAIGSVSGVLLEKVSKAMKKDATSPKTVLDRLIRDIDIYDKYITSDTRYQLQRLVEQSKFQSVKPENYDRVMRAVYMNLPPEKREQLMDTLASALDLVF